MVHDTDVVTDQSASSSARRLYTGTIVGLALFLVGILLWPASSNLKSTSAVVRLDVSQLSPDRRGQLSRELEQLRESLLSDTSLKEVVASIDERGESIEPSHVRRRLSIGMRAPDASGPLSGDQLKLQSQLDVVITMKGRDRLFQQSLVDRVATILATQWQQSLYEVKQLAEFDSARVALRDAEHHRAQIESDLERIPGTHRESLEAQLRGDSYSTDSSFQRTGFVESTTGSLPENDPGYPLASASRIGTVAEQGPSPSPTAEQNEQNRLAAEANRLEQLIDELIVQNQWTSAHPELVALRAEVESIRNKLSSTSRNSNSDFQLLSGQTDQPTLGSATFSAVQTNEYYREPAILTPNTQPQPASPSGAETSNLGMLAPLPPQPTQPMIDVERLEYELSSNLSHLQLSLDEQALAHRRVLGELQLAEQREPQMSAGQSFVLQPAKSIRISDPAGIVARVFFLLLLSVVAGVGFARFEFAFNTDSIDSVNDVESEVGIPVVGRLGAEESPDREGNQRRKRIASVALRTGELCCFAFAAAIVLALFLNPHLAGDFFDNPFLSFSHVIRSLF